MLLVYFVSGSVEEESLSKSEYKLSCALTCVERSSERRSGRTGSPRRSVSARLTTPSTLTSGRLCVKVTSWLRHSCAELYIMQNTSVGSGRGGLKLLIEKQNEMKVQFKKMWRKKICGILH